MVHHTTHSFTVYEVRYPAQNIRPVPLARIELAATRYEGVAFPLSDKGIVCRESTISLGGNTQTLHMLFPRAAKIRKGYILSPDGRYPI